MGSAQTSQVARDVMFVGLDNAGKSTIIKQILGHEALQHTYPTMGYDSFSYYYPVPTKCRRRLYKFNIIDLGGHERIRAIWKNYYNTSLGLVIVFDSADERRFQDVKTVIRQVLENNRGKIILFCANKQDQVNSIKTQQQFQSYFGVTMNTQMHFSATVGIEPNDSGLKEGIDWLFSQLVNVDYHEAELNKDNLKNQRPYAGLTTEEKLEKLHQIKKENDEYDEQRQLRKQRGLSDLDIAEDTQFLTNSSTTVNADPSPIQKSCPRRIVLMLANQELEHQEEFDTTVTQPSEPRHKRKRAMGVLEKAQQSD